MSCNPCPTESAETSRRSLCRCTCRAPSALSLRNQRSNLTRYLLVWQVHPQGEWACRRTAHSTTRAHKRDNSVKTQIQFPLSSQLCLPLQPPLPWHWQHKCTVKNQKNILETLQLLPKGCDLCSKSSIHSKLFILHGTST